MERLKHLKNDILKILSDIDDGKSFESISVQYNEYSKMMVEIIGKKNKKWYDRLFKYIGEELLKGMSEEGLSKELKNMRLDRKLINHLIDCLYEEINNESDGSDESNESDDLNKQLMSQDDVKIPNHSPMKVCKKTPKLITLDDIIFKDPRQNQYDALKYMFDNRIKISLNNTTYDVQKTGCCCQATGCGKTFIGLNAMKMVGMLNNYNPSITIIWFSERKSILTDLFLTFDTKHNTYIQNKDRYAEWKKNGIVDMDRFILYEFVHTNDIRWYERVNMITSKPKIIIINRTWLVNNTLYRLITSNIPCLIIHDEMHSCTNDTTYKFCKYVKETWNSSIIGFSATPFRMVSSSKQNKDLYKKIKYIYSTEGDALNVISNHPIMCALNSKPSPIVPPKFVLFNSEIGNMMDADNKYIWVDGDDYEAISKNEFICMMTKLNNQINTLPYRKLIAWCGTIKRCRTWKYLFDIHKKKYSKLIHTKTYMDHSQNIENEYELFKTLNSDGILFCADKHREGSDIYNLDGCMLLDNVRTRSILVFIQCIGRVMRRGVGKKFGLVIDSYIRDSDKTNNQAIISKIIEYYNQISNSSTHFADSKEKVNRYRDLKANLNLDISTKTIQIKCSGITIHIKCTDMTWNSIDTINQDITTTVKRELGFTQRDEKYLQRETGEKKVQMCRDIRKCLVDGQRVRHIAGKGMIWIGQYNASNNTIIHNDVEYNGSSPLNQFAKNHFIQDRPDRKSSEVNAWKDCECEIEGKWVSMYNL